MHAAAHNAGEFLHGAMDDHWDVAAIVPRR
jgi:hypothetical protein